MFLLCFFLGVSQSPCLIFSKPITMNLVTADSKLDEKKMERAVNRYLQVEYFTENFRRKPGELRSIHYITNVKEINFMVSSIKKDKLWPNVCGVSCKFVGGLNGSPYVDWKEKLFKKGLPTHPECSGPFIRLMQISQADGSVWIIDFFEFNSFPLELRNFFLNRDGASIWYNANIDMHALHISFSAITTETKFNSKQDTYSIPVGVCEESCFCYRWNIIDIQDVLMSLCASGMYQPLHGAFSFSNCVVGMFGYSREQSIVDQKIYYDHNKKLQDFKQCSLLNEFCTDALMMLDLGFACQRMFCSTEEPFLPIPNTTPFKNKFFLDIQKKSIEQWSQFLENKFKYEIIELSGTMVCKINTIFSEEDKEKEGALSTSQLNETSDNKNDEEMVLYFMYSMFSDTIFLF